MSIDIEELRREVRRAAGAQMPGESMRRWVELGRKVDGLLDEIERLRPPSVSPESRCQVCDAPAPQRPDGLCNICGRHWDRCGRHGRRHD